MCQLKNTAEITFQGREGLRKIVVCTGTGCVSNGSMDVYKTFIKELYEAGLFVVEVFEKLQDLVKPNSSAFLSKSGCQGFCQMGPLVTIEPDDILYTKVKVADVKEIVEKTLQANELIDRLLFVDPVTSRHCRSQKEIPFYQRQSRFVLKQCGEINPENIHEYIALGGYEAAKKAFTQMSDEDVCKLISDSGLRGRGGGGFPTGKKWDICRVQKNEKKYIICNADEGDPGAFMDRSVMEGNPHAVIEGMMIAARAIGADEGYIYVRAEYPLAVIRIRKAYDDALAAGILGDNIFNTGKKLHLHVKEGAGAFVCGEETALMASIEGGRGMPKFRPPFPAVAGLWGKPTVINNVETLATVPLIMGIGVEAYRKMGTHDSPGTKTFALSGYVANTGLIEVPFGLTLQDIIYGIGGGITDNKGHIDPNGFKAVQIGGPSGGCLTKEHLTLSLDFDSLRSIGAMVGSGGMVAMNQNTCMVAMAKYFMQFIKNESCGKCTFCRIGTKRMFEIMERITMGLGELADIDELMDLTKHVGQASLCQLGKTAPNPVLTTLRYFKDEYLEHIVEKKCRAKVCKALIRYTIREKECTGCTLCARKCPVSCISGERKELHIIDESRCTKCGTCFDVCNFGAVEVLS